MSEAAQKLPQRQPRRVVSGMRPTGRLHLGHYHGAVKNWIEISRKAECFFFSADWHALTSEYKDTSGIGEAQREMFADWVAAGLDPERCTLFIQSHVKQHAELYLLLAMVAPLGWLERAYSTPERVELVDRECRSAGIGCVDCKKMLLESLLPALEKHRSARAELDQTPGRIEELVQLGTRKATAVAEQTMAAVRDAVKLT